MCNAIVSARPEYLLYFNLSVYLEADRVSDSKFWLFMKVSVYVLIGELYIAPACKLQI